MLFNPLAVHTIGGTHGISGSLHCRGWATLAGFEGRKRTIPIAPPVTPEHSLRHLKLRSAASGAGDSLDSARQPCRAGLACRPGARTRTNASEQVIWRLQVPSQASYCKCRRRRRSSPPPLPPAADPVGP